MTRLLAVCLGATILATGPVTAQVSIQGGANDAGQAAPDTNSTPNLLGGGRKGSAPGRVGGAPAVTLTPPSVSQPTSPSGAEERH